MAQNPKWERNWRREWKWPSCFFLKSKAQLRREKWIKRHPDKWTDYPILELGDISGKIAPIRKIERIEECQFPSDKWVNIVVNGVKTETKRGYIYGSPRRCK